MKLSPRFILASLTLVLAGCQDAPLRSPVVSAPFPSSGVISSIGIPPEREAAMEKVEKEGSDAERKAERLFAEGRLAEAEAQCRVVNRIWGTRGDRMNVGVAYLLGRIRMRQGRYADAARFMGPNLDTTPTMRLDLALCLVKAGRVDEAREMYDPLLIVGHNSAFGDVRRHLPDVSTPARLEGGLLWCKAEALRMVGRGDEATDCFLGALARFPRNPLLGAELGFHAANAGRHRDAARGYGVVQASDDAFLKKETRDAATVERAKAVEEEKDKASVAPERTGG